MPDPQKPQYLRIKVIPRSNKTEILGSISEETPEGTVDTLKIRLKAVPEKNKANIELIKFLSKHFAVPKENISILSGNTSTLKLIKIIQN